MTYNEYLLKNNFIRTIDYRGSNNNFNFSNVLMQKNLSNNLILYINNIRNNYYHITIANTKVRTNSILYNNYKTINNNYFSLNYYSIIRLLKLKNII
jgi:hypothetical protein